ncbi:MAG: IS3 family transposase [Lachnospiraceae bacterium]|nr:IS3 family transposase [Lachnospiraceae bacterium]MDE6252703.1 IS3 family transposase [Lachnospiraceae bacterium]
MDIITGRKGSHLRELRKNALKERILEIYNESHQNYGAPKITECLKREGKVIAEKTVGYYMRDLCILQVSWIYIQEKSYHGY